MNKQKYLLIKNSYNKEIIYIDYNKLDGFGIKPKNKVKYDGIVVNKMIIIKPSFVEKLLKKKIKRKLNSYLQYIINNIENNDDEGNTNLKMALNDIERYRRLVKNKYRRYLDEKYYELLFKKLALLEKELRTKLLMVEINNYQYEEKEEKRRKTR